MPRTAELLSAGQPTPHRSFTRGGILAVMLFFTSTASAQFSTPIPSARPRDEVYKEEIRDLFVRKTLDSLPKDKRRDFNLQGTVIPNLAARRDTFCLERYGQDTVSVRTCRDAIVVSGDFTSRAKLLPSITRDVLALDFPFAHTRAELAEYMRATNDSAGVSLFSQFSTNVSENEAFVTTSIISGLAGRTIVGVNYAAVLVKAESADTTNPKTVESRTATVMQLVNNGGTLTARIQAPIYARSGASYSDAWSTYVTAGLIGPVGQSDSLKFAASGVGEVMMRFSLRNPAESSTLLGDLLVGVRGGIAFSPEGIFDKTHKSIPFGQLAVGLIQNNQLSLSVLASLVNSRYRDYMPRLMLNLSAIR